MVSENEITKNKQPNIGIWVPEAMATKILEYCAGRNFTIEEIIYRALGEWAAEYDHGLLTLLILSGEWPTKKGKRKGKQKPHQGRKLASQGVVE